MSNISGGTGSLIGDAFEFLADIIGRAGTDPEHVKALLKKEFTGRQLAEDIGHFKNLVRQKGLGGAVGEGYKTTADTLLRRSNPYKTIAGSGWGWSLPYTAYAVKDDLTDPNAGPVEKAFRAGSDAFSIPLTINPHMGFTTAAALNYGLPKAMGAAGSGIDSLMGTKPNGVKMSYDLFYTLAKIAVARKLGESKEEFQEAEKEEHKEMGVKSKKEEEEVKEKDPKRYETAEKKEHWRLGVKNEAKEMDLKRRLGL